MGSGSGWSGKEFELAVWSLVLRPEKARAHRVAQGFDWNQLVSEFVYRHGQVWVGLDQDGLSLTAR